jgi:hypothetical protein
MDVSINRPFKAAIRECWTRWMASSPPRTIRGNIHQPDRQLIIDWVSQAWEQISVEALVNSFAQCGISTALDNDEIDVAVEGLLTFTEQ